MQNHATTKRQNKDLASIDIDIDIDIDKSLAREPNFTECIKSMHLCYLRGLPPGVTPADFIAFVKKLFIKNSFSKRLFHIANQQQPKIPRIIHKIWFGEEMPKIYHDWHKTLHDFHPGWKFICWNEKKVEKEFPHGLYNQKTFDDAQKTNSYAQMSDVVRYEVLNKYGGLYIDYDVQCFKSFEFLHNGYDFYAGLEDFWSSCYCCNAVIGARSGHPILQACMYNIKQYENKEPNLEDWPYRSLADKKKFLTLITTGPKMFTHSIWQATNRNNSVLNRNVDIILPPEFFYPQTPTPASFCQHSFDSLWHGNLFEN